ncbi:MAG: hypothetical protein NTY08_12415 [Proteobacteria bacterium]|nr:hypothetical protein [Pseudomonadota bacterium]
MSRILEFTPSQEEALVSRVLVLVHQAMDDHLPHAGQANRRFTKTVFNQDAENTAISMAALQEEGANKDAASAELRGATPSAPEIPVFIPPVPTNARSSNQRPASAPSAEGASARPKEPENRPTPKPTKVIDGPDWVTRVTIALLISGLVLLAYVLAA